MIKVGVTLHNGSKHVIVHNGDEENWQDVVKFNRDSFVKDVEQNYILVSTISVFRFEGRANG